MCIYQRTYIGVYVSNKPCIYLQAGLYKGGSMTKVLAVANEKGGAGKTSTAVHLAGEFTAMGFTVALFDLDPQRSMTEWLLAGNSPLAACLHDVAYDPLAKDPRRRAFPVKAFTQAVQGLTTADQAPDYVLIDTPPSLHAEATLAACLLADLILIPVRPSAVDLRASDRAIATALEAADGKRNRLGLIPYGLTARAASSKDLPELLKAGGLQVLPAVSYREAVAKAAISGLPLSEFQPNSLARREFSELAAAVNKALKAARK